MTGYPQVVLVFFFFMRYDKGNEFSAGYCVSFTVSTRGMDNDDDHVLYGNDGWIGLALSFDE
jgi:hypothetical protein